MPQSLCGGQAARGHPYPALWTHTLSSLLACPPAWGAGEISSLFSLSSLCRGNSQVTTWASFERGKNKRAAPKVLFFSEDVLGCWGIVELAEQSFKIHIKVKCWRFWVTWRFWWHRPAQLQIHGKISPDFWAHTSPEFGENTKLLWSTVRKQWSYEIHWKIQILCYQAGNSKYKQLSWLLFGVWTVSGDSLRAWSASFEIT